MQIIEKGNYKLKEWSLEVECTGREWLNKNKPCHSILKLEDGDVVQRRHSEGISYGFICCECHCFTEVDKKLIPDEIKKYCLRVAAKGSDDYMTLTDEEKKLSEVL